VNLSYVQLHAVDHQANKDAYKLDSVSPFSPPHPTARSRAHVQVHIGKRPIPLHIAGKPAGLRLMPSDVIIAIFGDPEVRRRAREEKNRAAWEAKMSGGKGDMAMPFQQAEVDGPARGVQGGDAASSSVVEQHDEAAVPEETQPMAVDPVAL
jgi:hypothetical protein